MSSFREVWRLGSQDINHIESWFGSWRSLVNSFTSRFRLPAVICAVTFMFCVAISRPYAEMGVCDDWSYVRTAQLLSQTGHIHYNGWAGTMIGWQSYPAAALF